MPFRVGYDGNAGIFSFGSS